MVGEFGVGKTSIVNRYVNNEFTERYLSTIGVSIKQKSIEFNHHEMSLIIWDLAGEQPDSPLQSSYLRGLNGFVVVCDITQGNCSVIVGRMVKIIELAVGKHPYVVMLNKIDKATSISIENEIRLLESAGHKIFSTSAKTGDSIEAAFNYLLGLMDVSESLYG